MHRRLVVCCLVASLSGCATVITKPRKADLPPPAPEHKVVDFTPLLQLASTSSSVYLDTKDKTLMRRVLVGPNLVFESSRSSEDEPKTVGPANPTPDSPGLPDALGSPVSIAMSSLLIKHLGERGSLVLAPIATRRFTSEWWCTKDFCPKNTWVERLLLQHAPRRVDSKEAAGEAAALTDLPTSAFAVRELGQAWRRVDVVASTNRAGELELRPRRNPGEVSECPPMAIDVPTITFQAELVSLKDGHVLARIDERRSPKVNVSLRRTVAAAAFDPHRERDYTTLSDDGSKGEAYEYISGYERRPVLCAEVAQSYATVRDEISQRLTEELPTTALELFGSALEPMYH